MAQFLRCGWLLTDDDDSMSLQWYSPAEAAVADLVRKHSGITPTKWECFEALDRNRDGSYVDAADELLWKYAVERQQLDALSPTARAVAAIVPVASTKSGSEASDVDATGAVKKTSDGTPLCFIKNVEGSQALSTDEHLEIAWFAKGTTHSVNPNTGLS